MRIIGGKYKGHQLVNFSASHIRPTTDRVKESLFNILMHEIDGARVLDLFSGTGNLGIEALSRGAIWVSFVENHRQSLNLIHRNLEKLKITEDYDIHGKEVLSYLKKYEGPAFDIILIDPPFTKSMAHEVMQVLAQSSVFKETSLIAIESSGSEKLEDIYEKLYRYDQRDYGDKKLSLFEVRGEK